MEGLICSNSVACSAQPLAQLSLNSTKAVGNCSGDVLPSSLSCSFPLRNLSPQSLSCSTSTGPGPGSFPSRPPHSYPGASPRLGPHRTALPHPSHLHSHRCHHTACRGAGRLRCCWHRGARVACRPGTRSSLHPSYLHNHCRHHTPMLC